MTYRCLRLRIAARYYYRRAGPRFLRCASHVLPLQNCRLAAEDIKHRGRISRQYIAAQLLHRRYFPLRWLTRRHILARVGIYDIGETTAAHGQPRAFFAQFPAFPEADEYACASDNIAPLGLPIDADKPPPWALQNFGHAKIDYLLYAVRLRTNSRWPRAMN